MTPDQYVPQYDETVIEYGPTSQIAITKEYCLLPVSAMILASFFDPKPEIFYADPVKQNGKWYTFSREVPWLRFTDKSEWNAGQLATCWITPGIPASQALGYAKQYITIPVGV